MVPGVRHVLLLALAAGLAAVATSAAQSGKDGLPSYTSGYSSWPKVNRKPIVGGSSAHQGTKNVFASKRQQGRRYPVGTILVKAATPPGKKWLSLVATMRRIKGSTNGGWRWEEFTRSSPSRPFTKIAFSESGCAACHVQAKSNDYVFTRR